VDLPDEPPFILPFQGMSVGDSFFIPTLRPSNIIYAVDTRSKAVDTRVKCYATVKDGCLGVRVWRIR
jgi:hypothetical protein